MQRHDLAVWQLSSLANPSLWEFAKAIFSGDEQSNRLDNSRLYDSLPFQRRSQHFPEKNVHESGDVSSNALHALCSEHPRSTQRPFFSSEPQKLFPLKYYWEKCLTSPFLHICRSPISWLFLIRDPFSNNLLICQKKLPIHWVDRRQRSHEYPLACWQGKRHYFLQRYSHKEPH